MVKIQISWVTILAWLLKKYIMFWTVYILLISKYDILYFYFSEIEITHTMNGILWSPLAKRQVRHNGISWVSVRVHAPCYCCPCCHHFINHVHWCYCTCWIRLPFKLSSERLHETFDLRQKVIVYVKTEQRGFNLYLWSKCSSLEE